MKKGINTVKNIIKGKFISVWDGGIEVETNCKINLETKEIFDIQLSDIGEELETLNEQFVRYTINKIVHKEEVCQIDEVEESYTGFWYN